MQRPQQRPAAASVYCSYWLSPRFALSRHTDLFSHPLATLLPALYHLWRVRNSLRVSRLFCIFSPVHFLTLPYTNAGSLHPQSALVACENTHFSPLPCPALPLTAAHGPYTPFHSHLNSIVHAFNSTSPMNPLGKAARLRTTAVLTLLAPLLFSPNYSTLIVSFNPHLLFPFFL